MFNINSEISNISGVGEKSEKKLKKLGINTINDLLFYYPFRFENYGKLKKIKDLKPKEKCIFLARIDLIDSKRSIIKRKNFTKVIAKDDTGKIEIVWFNNPWVKDSIKSGDLYYFIGEVGISGINNIEVVNPIFKKYDESSKKINNEIIFPIYRTTSGLKQYFFRNLLKKILESDIKLIEYIPENILEKYNYFDINKSIKNIHSPKKIEDLENAINRLKFDELFIYQLINESRKKLNKLKKAISVNFFEQETKEFIKSFGFELTDKQKKVSWEILLDIKKNNPMNRLLEGDVGSGKTAVFLIAALNTILNDLSVSIMTPTAILANQHYKKVCDLFLNKKFIKKDLKICLLTNGTTLLNNKKISKKELEKIINNGEADIIIGTHSLISNNIDIKNLGLVIVDEQHRFGVSQRKKITENINKIENNKFFPHFLSVTATPIPRTLALAFYGDLDISILDEKPKNRKKIMTKITNNTEEIYKFIKNEVKKGNQIYIICPLIEEESESENLFDLEIKSVKKTFDKISNLAFFKDINIGLLHGKMKEIEKTKIEKDFSSGRINILIATSVVEVGVDVPNSTCIVIFGAEKFGLAQLYQLRGRVGRGDKQSYCFLYTNSNSEKSINRLNNLIKAKNSFELAELDIKERGFGEIYGLKQSGHIPELKIASFFDYEIMKRAQNEARNIIDNINNYKILKNKIEEKELDIHFE